MTAHEPESLDLLTRARDGDRGAMGELLERYRDRLLVRVRLMMGPDARRVAESTDFVQGALTDALLELDRIEIRDEKRLLRWLTTVVRNNVREGVRKRRERAFESYSDSWVREPSDTNGTPSPASEAEQRDSAFRLAEALEELDELQREVVELHAIQGLSFAAVARALDRSESGVRLLFDKAVVRLGRQLGA